MTTSPRTGPRPAHPGTADAADTADAANTAATAATADEANAQAPRTAPGEPSSSRAYAVYRPVLPAVCPRRPHLMAFTGDADGRCEVFTYDRRTGASRQVTDRPHGTLLCSIDADAAVWWFDEDRGGRGEWRYQDFAGGPHRTALPGAPAGRPCGLAMTDHGVTAVGVGGPDGLTVHLGRRGGPSRPVLRTEGHALLCDLSPRGDLLAVTGAPDSDRAVTLAAVPRDASRTDAGRAAPVAVLSGAGERTWALGFAPGRDEPELLVLRERDGRYHLGTWRRATGLEVFPWCSFDTEVTARWYPDGTGRILVRQVRHGRGLLFTASPATRTLTRVPTPRGSLLDAAPTPDGDVQYIWTDVFTPPRPRSLSGAPLPGPPPRDLPPYGEHRDLWTPGPDGAVHTLLTTPAGRPAPHPLVMLVHGGPADHDRDAYDAMVHSLTASGFAVARVNYRGSTGYGPRWRAAYTEGVGHTQVADLTAVRADLIRQGVTREGTVSLCGTSFGGYLALLALGTHPGLWNAGVAVKPIADYATAFRHTTPALKALDTALFGGTPDEVPEAYAHASPLTYADAITAPLLLVAARQDAKCPPEQVEAYAAALRERGVPHELVWLDSGHDGYDGGQHVAVMERSLRFLAAALPPARAGRPPAASPPAAAPPPAEPPPPAGPPPPPAAPAPAAAVPAPSGAGPNPTDTA